MVFSFSTTNISILSETNSFDSQFFLRGMHQLVRIKDIEPSIKEWIMLKEPLDKLLVTHFNKPSDSSKLDDLVPDVWRRICMQRADITLPWHEKMVLAFSLPQFRLASISMAIIIGLSLAPAIKVQSRVSTSDVMGLKVFAVNTPYLLTNQITGK